MNNLSHCLWSITVYLTIKSFMASRELLIGFNKVNKSKYQFKVPISRLATTKLSHNQVHSQSHKKFSDSTSCYQAHFFARFLKLLTNNFSLNLARYGRSEPLINRNS